MPIRSPYQVEVIRSARRKKSITLRIVDNRVIVQAPLHTKDAYIEQILDKRKAWIDSVIQRNKTLEQTNHRTQVAFRLFDRPFSMKAAVPQTSAWQFEIDPDNFQIKVTGPTSEVPYRVLQSVMVDWFKQYARIDFSRRLDTWARRLDVEYLQFRLKDQKTRWGSCSSKGNINLNWRLIQAPESVIDYVVVHELCHLKEMNHSKRFWNLVEQALPTYDHSKQWLRRYGSSLHF